MTGTRGPDLPCKGKLCECINDDCDHGIDPCHRPAELDDSGGYRCERMCKFCYQRVIDLAEEER